MTNKKPSLENITLENVEIANAKGPVLNLYRTKNAVLDRLTYPAGAEAVVKAQGAGNSGIVIENTQLPVLPFHVASSRTT